VYHAVTRLRHRNRLSLGVSDLSGFRHAVILLVTALIVSSLLAQVGSMNFKYAPSFHTITPTGYNIVQLRPSGRTVELLAVVECPEIEGMKQLSEGLNAKVITTQGVPLEHFPRHFSFRVTATLRRLILEPPERIIDSEEAPQQFLLHLQFRLKAYNGLRMDLIEPEAVTLIGVPQDVAYDERVFRIQFDVDDLPVTERVVLEAVSPQGETLSHFPFGLL